MQKILNEKYNKQIDYQEIVNTIDKARKTIFGNTDEDCSNLINMLE